MFVVLLTYKKPLENIDQYLIQHRAFLEECYKKDFFIASGPRNPRTGGVIISQLKDLQYLKDILSQDPFKVHGLVDYEIIEFNPVKYHNNFAGFI